MSVINTIGRLPIVGVVGGGAVTAGSRDYALAVEVGAAIAGIPGILAQGGFGGVMQAAREGAAKGRILSILPDDPVSVREMDPNHVEVFTGLADARNYVIAVTSDLLIAMPGGPGSLSEIALALKTDHCVICHSYWGFLRGAPFLHALRPNQLSFAHTADEMIDVAKTRLGADEPTRRFVDRENPFPLLPGLERLRDKVGTWLVSP